MRAPLLFLALLTACDGGADKPQDADPVDVSDDAGTGSDSDGTATGQDGAGDDGGTGDEGTDGGGEDDGGDDGSMGDDGSDGTGDDTGTPDPLAGRCHTELTALTGTAAPDDLLLDSIAEVHCDGGDACYEHVAIYEDGVVVYQNIRLTGGSIACTQLGSLSAEDRSTLPARVATLMADEGDWVDFDDCSSSDPASAEFGVDGHRGQVSPGFVRTFFDNLTCRGAAAAPPFRSLLAGWWAVAPRSFDPPG